MSVAIDGIEAKVPFGTTILEAAKNAGVKIPTLCDHPDLDVAGVCRMCVVEVEGQRTLQPACTFPVVNQMKIKTHTRKVRMARKHVLELLLSEHCGECYSCVRNGNCELQSLAEEYGITEFAFGHPTEPMYEPDTSSYSVMRDMNKCIRCRRCIRTCIDMQEVGVLEAIGRSNKVTIETFEDMPLGSVVCINCGQCVNRCPVGALYAKDETDAVWAAIDDPDKHVVIQTAPAPRSAMGEVFGLEPGTPVTFEMNTALRRAGFDMVFDTNFTADLTIIEEGTELILRLYKALVEGDEDVALPQFTSCSPGWVKYLEHFYPEYLPNASSAKSPQQMFGALIKTYYAEKLGLDPAKIVSCRAHAVLGQEVRVQPARDGRLRLPGRRLRAHHARARQDVQGGRPARAEPAQERLRRPVRHRHRLRRHLRRHRRRHGERRLRTVIELVTGSRSRASTTTATSSRCAASRASSTPSSPSPKSARCPRSSRTSCPNWDWLNGATLKVAVAHGTANAKKVMDDIKAGGKFSECHFIEIMACPGGCLGGGGQPIPTSPEIRAARAKAIYAEDHAYEVRKSHENPAVAATYAEFLTDGPCGHKSHKLLHTEYTARGKHIPQD